MGTFPNKNPAGAIYGSGRIFVVIIALADRYLFFVLKST